MSACTYLSRDFVGATWGLELSRDIPAHYGSRDGKRKVHKQEDGHHQLNNKWSNKDQI